MPPRLRKAALAVHVACSVGWIGAVVAYLVLAVAGRTSQDPGVVRGAHLAMEVTVWQAVVPLSAGSLASGLLSSLGTTWGLFRHYWVLFKLVLNLIATGMLLAYSQGIGEFAGIAAQPEQSSADLAALRSGTHVIHSAGGLIVLLTALVLAIYKPRGMTAYGQRKAVARSRAWRAPPRT